MATVNVSNLYNKFFAFRGFKNFLIGKILKASWLANLYRKRRDYISGVHYLESALFAVLGLLGIPVFFILYLYHLPFMAWPVLAIGFMQIILFLYMALDALFQMLAKYLSIKILKIEKKQLIQLGYEKVFEIDIIVPLQKETLRKGK